MPTVAVVGAGEVGGAVAEALAAGGRTSCIVLIDAAGGVAAGKALDLRQAGALIGGHTRLDVATDVTAAAGCDLCIVADRADAAAGEWRGDEGFALLARLLQYAADAPVVFAGASQDDLLARATHELGTARHRLIGSAPEALTSAVRALVAAEAGSAPAEVAVALLGRPGRFVIPWSQATIGGYALERVLSQARQARLEARVPFLWPPGPRVLGVAAARTAEAIQRTSRRTVHGFVVLDGELSVRGRVCAMPVRLCPAGVAEVIVPDLSPRDRASLQTSVGE